MRAVLECAGISKAHGDHSVISGFDAVVQRAVAIESPPPAGSSIRATTYDALADIDARIKTVSDRAVAEVDRDGVGAGVGMLHPHPRCD